MMRVITSEQLETNPTLLDEAVQVLKDDGLLCFPGRRQYSIAASLWSPDAVIALVQSKRRSGKAPSLVLIPDETFLDQVADEVTDVGRRLAKTFWPGALTFVVRATDELPSKVRKTIGIKPGRIGVRVPATKLTHELLLRFGGPLLISSANMSQKGGAGSASSVRKNFHHTVDMMIDAGDINPQLPSTIVDLTVQPPQVTREGLVTTDQVMAVINET